MSVYAQGLGPTAPVGDHFHLNNVAFAFLLDLCCWVSAVAKQVGDYNENEGEGLDAVDAGLLAHQLKAAIADGRVARFDRVVQTRGAPPLAQVAVEFAAFCEACGGFEILP